LECCRAYPVEHLIYASSSSVYGNNTKVPFSETDRVDKPVSLYAATKKSNELMAESYSHLYGMPLTGLRFFTVYGPWGRPDMAPYLFTSAILKGEKIKVFNYGKNWRDFTFVDDIVDVIFKVLMSPQPTGHRIFNIGNNCPVTVLDFIKALEEISGRKADLEMLPAQPGDVLATHANIDSLNAAVGYMPTTDLRKGLEKFVDWYRKYYHL
jgi:UDP-glucuronate 4-epimerase